MVIMRSSSTHNFSGTRSQRVEPSAKIDVIVAFARSYNMSTFDSLMCNKTDYEQMRDLKISQ